MVRIVCLLIGYVFGLFQTAYIYGKAKGIDIREHGSGNAGTTNTLRVFGLKAGLIVLLGDLLKCAVAIVLVRFTIGRSYPDMLYLLLIYTAAGVILGHDFPFYLNFKGGKGIAATAGLIAAFHPYFIPVGLIAFFTIFFTTHYVSLGSLCVYAAFITQLIVMGQCGFFGMEPVLLYEMYAVGAFMTFMAYFQHRANIVRLLKGEERKTYLFKKNEQ
ncbi:MAG: glycerol-3-phosphate 1-O-acyltransferase PlsY [Lachnospiraceae bacterium]|nr:glycerol-3-phosphate 1-O-acyltransferase PlsY [Lachnospiraceae bacterium]